MHEVDSFFLESEFSFLFVDLFLQLGNDLVLLGYLLLQPLNVLVSHLYFWLQGLCLPDITGAKVAEVLIADNMSLISVAFVVLQVFNPGLVVFDLVLLPYQ